MNREPRSMANRSTTERRRPREEEESIYWIDPKVVPPGMKYQWKTEMVMGMQAREMLASNLKNGWKPVPSERHPDLVPPPLPGQEPETLIRRGGHILCEMPEEYVQEDYDNNERRTKETTHAKEAELGMTKNPLYPKTASLETTVSRFDN